MKTKRKKYSASQKASIVHELLEGEHTLSDLSVRHQIHPTQITRWKKQLFEWTLETFNQNSTRSQQRFDKEVDGLKSKLAHKDGIIVELLEENLRLKKNDGDY